MDMTINNAVSTGIIWCPRQCDGTETCIIQWYLCRYLTKISGCDSIVTMNLTVNYASVGFDSIIACDSLIWNGNV